MDIKDKLAQLRKDRDARRPADPKPEEAWRAIEADASLTTKQKLQRLIDLTGAARGPRPRPAGPAAPSRVPAEPFRFTENPFRVETRYGQVPIGLGLRIPGDILAFLGRDPVFRALDLSSALFLDLETTGLAGGTGTVPFLVGLGYYRGERFHVAQFFLEDLAGEERMVREVGRFLEEGKFTSLVTYNGKAFDLPLLETRFILHRLRFPAAELPHLDFLFSARTLWQHRFDSCRLGVLAQEICKAPRDEDIPSAEIPLRYFHYLRSRDFSAVEPILYHNQEDILSLLGVVVAASLLVSRGREAVEAPAAAGPLPSAGAVAADDALDAFGVARLFERAGDGARSAALMEKALHGGLRGEASEVARKALSRHFKKARDWDKAKSLWQGDGAEDQLYCRRELAMFFEHREGNLEEAVRVAEDGLALSLERQSAFYRQDFEKRLTRLRGKLRRAKP